MSAPSLPAESVWRAPYLWTTAGAFLLIFWAAFESMAVTTVMPGVSKALDGEALFAVAFSGTMAASVVGMILAGIWCDRARPLVPLMTAVGVFVAGLVIAGVATSMPMLVVGRLIQGLGAGAETVIVYVVVARAYPAALHGRVFAAFSAAWVVPSLIGPFLAGLVADHLHWRWVFLGVGILTALAFTMVLGRVRRVGGPTEAATATGVLTRVAMAVVVAAAATTLSMLGDWGWPPLPMILTATALVIVVAVCVRPLVPRGTLHAARGLPSVVAMRGLISAAMLGTEIYVPYLLSDVYGFSATYAGLALTGGAVAWSVASEIQGRIGGRVGNRRTAVIGLGLLAISVGAVALIAAAHAPWWLIVVAWTGSGAGIGFAYPRLSVLGLAYATPQNQGFVSSSLTIADSLTTSVTIAVLGMIMTLGGSFAIVFAIGAVIAVVALVPGTRLGHAAEADAVAQTRG